MKSDVRQKITELKIIIKKKNFKLHLFVDNMIPLQTKLKKILRSKYSEGVST